MLGKKPDQNWIWLTANNLWVPGSFRYFFLLFQILFTQNWHYVFFQPPLAAPQFMRAYILYKVQHICRCGLTATQTLANKHFPWAIQSHLTHTRTHTHTNHEQFLWFIDKTLHFFSQQENPSTKHLYFTTVKTVSNNIIICWLYSESFMSVICYGKAHILCFVLHFLFANTMIIAHPHQFAGGKLIGNVLNKWHENVKHTQTPWQQPGMPMPTTTTTTTEKTRSHSIYLPDIVNCGDKFVNR